VDIDSYHMRELRQISLSLFNKNYFGVFHGSLSAKVDTSSFVINKKMAMFDELDEGSLVRLDCFKRDYRWKSASIDVEIHKHIYETISSAKSICFSMPPYATAYALKHSKVAPQDYFGQTALGEVMVYDPKSFHDWYERAPYEISRFFRNNNTHLLLVKGYGLYAYDRNLTEMAKKISILENSCRLLVLSASL